MAPFYYLSSICYIAGIYSSILGEPKGTKVKHIRLTIGLTTGCVTYYTYTTSEKGTYYQAQQKQHEPSTPKSYSL